MARTPWHILRSDDDLTLARHLPPRFDVMAETRLTPAQDVSRGVLAHQIRQDIWRAMQSVRGFSPVVRIAREGADLRVMAGGRVAGRTATSAPDRLANVLENPANRRRWLTHAGCAA